MPQAPHNTAADRAAEAFYGQTNSEFTAQIAQICGNDPKLMQAFERTRDRFLGKVPQASATRLGS